MEWVEIFQNMGFPMACVVAMGAFVYKAFGDITETNKQREERLYKTIDESRAMLSKLTEINATFVATLEDHKVSLEEIQNDVAELKHFCQNRKEADYDDAK